MSIETSERALYDDVWSHDAYRRWSPGVEAVPRFMRLTSATPPETVIDFGCGTGRAGAALFGEGFLVTLADQTNAGLEITSLPFHRHCLWQSWPHERHAYGFCVDVLEHVPTELTGLTIARMLDACRVLYLEVATVPDTMGMLVGHSLHKTVKPFVWWRDVCQEIGVLAHGVDMLTRAAFVLRRDRGAA